MGPRRVGGPNLEKVRPRRWGPEGGAPKGWGPRPRKSEAPKVGPRRVGPRRVGPRSVGPRRWGTRRVGPRRVGPKISRFFFPFPPPFRSHCVSLGVFSWNFGGVLKRRSPQMCTFGVLGLVGPPGFHTTAREPKRAHFRVPAFKTPPKFNEKTPKRGRNNEHLWWEKGKKERNFGRSGGGRSGGGRSGGGQSGGRRSGGVQTHNHNKTEPHNNNNNNSNTNDNKHKTTTQQHNNNTTTTTTTTTQQHTHNKTTTTTTPENFAKTLKH